MTWPVADVELAGPVVLHPAGVTVQDEQEAAGPGSRLQAVPVTAVGAAVGDSAHHSWIHHSILRSGMAASGCWGISIDASRTERAGFTSAVDQDIPVHASLSLLQSHVAIRLSLSLGGCHPRAGAEVRASSNTHG